MPSNLTGQQINDTYSQLLHVDGGPDAAEKPVYSGTGVATALNVGVASASVGNVRLAGNSIAAISGTLDLTAPVITGGSITGITDLAVADGGTGASDAATARTNLGLGTISTQAANNVAITGGSITGVTLPFGSIIEQKYGMFSDITDQTGSTSAATAVKFGTNEINTAGITSESNGSANTRITFATAGTYEICPSLQLYNSDSSDHNVTIWFALNGTAIPRSATIITVPKLADGGQAFFQIMIYQAVTASQYIEVMWLPSNTAISLDHTAAGAIAPAIPSAIVVARRIA